MPTAESIEIAGKAKVLIDGGAPPKQAFEQVGAEIGKSATSVSTAYYRVARADPAYGVKHPTKTTRRSRVRKPARTGSQATAPAVRGAAVETTVPADVAPETAASPAVRSRAVAPRKRSTGASRPVAARRLRPPPQ
jgi:hypothetical protein